MKVFLGTNNGHNAAAAVIGTDGTLVYAAEEERLLNRLDYSGFPEIAVSRIAVQFGPKVVGWSEGWDRRSRLLQKGLALSVRFGWRDQQYLRERFGREVWRFAKDFLVFRRWKGHFGAARYVGHHEAHAYSLLPWGLPCDSLILVSDYTGERWAISCFHWNGREMRALCRAPFPHSLGAAYQELATHLGFHGRKGAGKVMALAAYGEPQWSRVLNDTVRLDGISLCIDQKRFPIWRRRQAWTEFGEAVGGRFRTEVQAASGNGELGRDLAASAQEWLTETTWRYLTNCVRHAKGALSLRVRALGLAGGCALNCQANGDFVRRLSELGVAQLCVSPWSDDSGTAIGAAAHAALTANPDIEFKSSSPFVGPSPSDSIARIADQALQSAAKVLATGGIVALATGRLEFGPRALGGRCLFGDPRSRETKDRLNNVKGRPAFMPFAPIVLEENYGRYFQGSGSTNMAWTVGIRPEIRAAHPGMDHASGRARVQVVTSDGPTVLRRILSIWQDITGCGVLLLTSLNGHDEAIPASAAQCLSVAKRLGADGLLADEGWIPFH